MGALLGMAGGGGASVSTSFKSSLDQTKSDGAVSFGSNNVGSGAGGGNSLLYVLGAVVLLGAVWLFKR